MWWIFNPKWMKLRPAILNCIFGWIFDGFSIEKSMPETRKIIKFYWENNHFLLAGDFKIRWLVEAIQASTWVDFGTKNRRKSALGGLLGRHLGLLGPSWTVLEAS